MSINVHDSFKEAINDRELLAKTISAANRSNNVEQLQYLLMAADSIELKYAERLDRIASVVRKQAKLVQSLLHKRIAKITKANDRRSAAQAMERKYVRTISALIESGDITKVIRSAGAMQAQLDDRTRRQAAALAVLAKAKDEERERAAELDKDKDETLEVLRLLDAERPTNE